MINNRPSAVWLININSPAVAPVGVVDIVATSPGSHRRTRHAIVYTLRTTSLPQFAVPHRPNPVPRPAISHGWRTWNKLSTVSIRRTVRMIDSRRPIANWLGSYWPRSCRTRRRSVPHRATPHRRSAPLAFVAHLAYHRTYRRRLWTTKTSTSFRHHRRWQVVHRRPPQDSLRSSCSSLISVNPQPAFAARLNF